MGDIKIEEQSAIDAWVHRLNRLGADLDDEALSMHPAAWHEALSDRIVRWKRLAKSPPKCAVEESVDKWQS